MVLWDTKHTRNKKESNRIMPIRWVVHKSKIHPADVFIECHLMAKFHATLQHHLADQCCTDQYKDKKRHMMAVSGTSDCRIPIFSPTSLLKTTIKAVLNTAHEWNRQVSISGCACIQHYMISATPSINLNMGTIQWATLISCRGVCVCVCVSIPR